MTRKVNEFLPILCTFAAVYLNSMTKRNIIIAAVAAVALIAVSALWLKGRADMAEMVEVFTEEKETLLREYQDLYLDYDSLGRYNTEINDKLDQERERVAQLQEELKTVRATNARRIKELQGELTTMRTVMVSFVRQIDSLNQTNIKLVAENQEMKSQVSAVRQQYANLQNENKTLSEQVEIASRLEAIAISAEGLNYSEKVVRNASKISKVKVNFTIAKNISAQSGMKKVYLRLSRPDGQLLMHSKDDLFTFENTKINFSAFRDVEYGGDEVATYIVYKVDAGELMEGTYDIELFCGGDLIGKGSWSVKR